MSELPINEKISGYWDTLIPEDLISFDKALDIAYGIIESQPQNHPVGFAIPSTGLARIFFSSLINSLSNEMPPREAFYRPYTPPGIPDEEK